MSRLLHLVSNSVRCLHDLKLLQKISDVQIEFVLRPMLVNVCVFHLIWPDYAGPYVGEPGSKQGFQIVPLRKANKTQH